MRSPTAILVNLALLLAFVEAPFLHIHQHEATQRHPGPILHLHLKSVHSLGSGPEIQGLDPDDDAQFQNWFSAAGTDSALTVVVLTERFRISGPEHSGWAVEAPLQVGHDPPISYARNPRAPPA